MPIALRKKRNILYVENGNIFESDADVLVNSVNTKGVMGAGIAREFAKLFPEMYEDYRKACRSGRIRIEGKFLITITKKSKELNVIELTCWEPHVWKGMFRGREVLILNFPSKIYWDLPSHPKIIEAGLKWICNNIEYLSSILGRRITKIALPQVGTGLGGLKWRTVKDLIEKHLSSCEDVTVEVYLNYSKRKSSRTK
ncbi:MAG: macro domain-containing protein [Zestosphaera sp.]